MPPVVGRLLQTSRQFAAVGLVAVVVYANTLLCDFTFDDNFAVVCVLSMLCMRPSLWYVPCMDMCSLTAAFTADYKWRCHEEHPSLGPFQA
jgi:hypothetical protein